MCIAGKTKSAQFQLSGADQKRMESSELIALKMHLPQLGEVTWPVMIVKNLSQRMIIGNDLLDYYTATIQYQNGGANITMKSGEQEPSEAMINSCESVVCATERTAVHPGEIRAVTVRPANVIPDEGTVCLLEAAQGGPKIQEGLVRARAQKVQCLVHNDTDETLWLERGRAIATICLLQSDDYWSVRPKAADTVQRTAAAKDKKEMISQAANASDFSASSKQELYRILLQQHTAIAGRGQVRPWLYGRRPA